MAEKRSMFDQPLKCIETHMAKKRPVIGSILFFYFRCRLFFKKKEVRGKNRPKTKIKIFQYSHEALKAALHEIKENKMPVKLASRTYVVPRATIHDHLLGKIPAKQGKTGSEPLLTAEGENKIADWVYKLAKCVFPLRRLI